MANKNIIYHEVIYNEKKGDQTQAAVPKKMDSKHDIRKALYGRTNLNAPVGENCQLRGFDKYFFL